MVQRSNHRPFQSYQIKHAHAAWNGTLRIVWADQPPLVDGARLQNCVLARYTVRDTLLGLTSQTVGSAFPPGATQYIMQTDAMDGLDLHQAVQ